MDHELVDRVSSTLDDLRIHRDKRKAPVASLDMHVPQRPSRALLGARRSGVLGNCHLACTMPGIIYSAHSPVMDVVMKNVYAQQGLDDSVLVKCRLCGDLINADIDSIEEHSLVCLPVKCRYCGQMIGASIDAIEAHLSVCIPVVEQPEACAALETMDRHHRDLSVPRPLFSPICYDAVGHALADFSNRNLRCLSQPLQQAYTGVPLMPLQVADEAFLDHLRMEVRGQVEALREQQQAAMSCSPLQIIVDNSATASAEQVIHREEPQVHHVSKESTDMWWRNFVDSPGNRIVLLTLAQFSLYFANSYLNHHYRMAELQRRVDANAFLRFQQILSNQLKVLL